MKIDIIYANKNYFESFYKTLSFVAQEKVYIEMIQAPPYEKVVGFQTQLIEANGPGFYAINEEKVVGWCDIFTNENPRQSHRGNLGMGLLPKYRGKGIGPQLVNKTLEHAKLIGIEKVELQVYTSNTNAIKMYKKLGFTEEGLLKKYRKLENLYFDCLTMAYFF